MEVIFIGLIFVLFYLPDVRSKLTFIKPRSSLEVAIVRYRDDDDLRDFIDSIQRQVGRHVTAARCTKTQNDPFRSFSAVAPAGMIYWPRVSVWRDGLKINTGKLRNF